MWPNQRPEHERPPVLRVIDLPFALHYPQQSLDRFVIRRWIFARRFHDVLDCASAYPPQNLQQTKFPGTRQYDRMPSVRRLLHYGEILRRRGSQGQARSFGLRSSESIAAAQLASTKIWAKSSLPTDPYKP